MSSSKAPESKSALDGVVNPQSLLMGGFAVVFAAFVPVTSYITTPGGVFESVLTAFLRVTLPNAANVPADRVIPALAAVYVFVTFAATGAFSVAGVGSAFEKGLDNSAPRAQVNNLRGLPLRLRSAHYNLMEMFPSWAIVAALAQVLAPTNRQVINLLGLHVFAKVVVYYPSYLLDVAPTRSLAHAVATGSVVNVAYRLAMGES